MVGQSRWNMAQPESGMQCVVGCHCVVTVCNPVKNCAVNFCAFMPVLAAGMSGR